MADDPIWKRAGFTSQFSYRDFLAKAQGYTSYRAQRVARQIYKETKDATRLRGSDLLNFAGINAERGMAPRPTAERAVKATKGIAPSPYSFPRTTLYEFDQQVQEIANGLISRKKFDGKFAKTMTVVRRNKGKMVDQIDKHLPTSLDLADQDAFVARAYRQGLADAATAGGAEMAVIMKEIDKRDVDRLEQMSKSGNKKLRKGVENWERNASRWDASASKVTSAKEAKKQVKQRIHAADPGDRYKSNLSELERGQYDLINHRAYTMGFMKGMGVSGVEYFEVIDGPGCGWLSHNDPQLANGMVVSAQEAEDNPLAHRSCIRTFKPILDPKEGKRRHKENKKTRVKKFDIKSDTQKIIAGAGIALSLMGLTTEVAVEGTFVGTVGDTIVSEVAAGLERAAYRMLDSKNRALQMITRRLAARGFKFRLDDLVTRIAAESGADPKEIEQAILDNIHSQAQNFEVADEAVDNAGTVLNQMSRTVIGIKQQELLKVAGDQFDEFERWRHFQFYNELIENSPTAGKLADLIGRQDIISNIFYNETRFKGKFFRFSMPRINTIDGNTGERRTARYLRFGITPNDIANLHFTALPKKDQSLRLISNLKLNPNGMVRMGFVRGEDGLIRPNISLVPRGPLRIRSVVNRAGKYTSKTETLYEYVVDGIGSGKSVHFESGALVEFKDPNTGEILYKLATDTFQDDMPKVVLRKTTRNARVLSINAGRVNSITTEAVLKTRWSPVSDMMWYKFRVNMKHLGVRNFKGLKDITVEDWRRWSSETDNKFDWLSAGINIRLRGGNLFDFSRSIRIDPTTKYRIWNVEKNLDRMKEIFTDGVEFQAKSKRVFDDRVPVYDINGMPSRPQADEFRLFPEGYQTRGIFQKPGAGQSFQDYLGDQVLNWLEVYYRSQYLWHEADLPELMDDYGHLQATLDEIQNESVKRVAMTNHSPWEMMQYKWSMVKAEMQSRYEELTDYLIRMQRSDLAARADDTLDGKWTPQRLIDKLVSEGIEVDEAGALAEKYYWEKPDLVVALIESDPKLIAKDLKERAPSLIELRTKTMEALQATWDQYRSFMPESVQQRVDKRFADNILFGERLATVDQIHESPVGALRFHVPAGSANGDIFTEGGNLVKGFRPGDDLDMSRFGKVRLFASTPRSLKGLRDAPQEIVEFVVDGRSMQRWRGGIPYLHGKYEVVGYTKMNRAAQQIHSFPSDMPDGVEVVHRIYIQQKGMISEDLADFVAAIESEPLLSQADHADRLRILRNAFPFEVDALNEYISRPDEIFYSMWPDASPSDRRIADRIKQMIDGSEPINNDLYRVFTGRDAKTMIDRLTDDPIYEEVLGTWSVKTDGFHGATEGRAKKLVLVLRNAHGINLGPVRTEPGDIVEFLTSGMYRFARRLDDATENTVYIYMDYIRPVV